jgi:tRNA nucleotidyltransferase (CCA-adding enzyme)
VGGAVRDALLGEPAGDRDWVVIGATPEQMVALGFTPVGSDFPVFLHPVTHDQYALARTERKAGRGYKGFVFQAGPEVTLEQDLLRRDLTINAMAMDADGRLFDPYGGLKDLNERRLRHVSKAFGEDPLRILRLARFAARLPGFTVDPQTLEFCREMVRAGEVDALVPERVWQEISRGLMALQPSRMIEVLQACDAWPRLAPGLSAVTPAALDLDLQGLGLAERTALMLRQCAHPQRVLRHWRAPREAEDMACLFKDLPQALKQAAIGSAQERLAVLDRLDAWRKPERCQALIALAHRLDPGIDSASWHAWMKAARALDAGAIAAQCQDARQIAAAIRASRLQALA